MDNTERPSYTPKRRPTPLELRMGRAGARRWLENKKAEDTEERTENDSDIFARIMRDPR